MLFTVSTEQLIKDFYVLGSALKVAEKYVVAHQTIYSRFSDMGFDCRPERFDIIASITKEMLEKDYDEYGQYSAIAKKYGVSRETITRLCKKFGVIVNKKIIHTCDELFFSRENEQSFYVAGFIAADGCVQYRKQKQPSLSMGLSKKDVDHMIAIKNAMRSTHNIWEDTTKNAHRNPNWNDRERVSFEIFSTTIVEDLKKFNIVPRKSLILTFPDWLITHPLVHHFMRGYFDGDGCFHIQDPKQKTKQIAFSARGTTDFLTTFATILNSNTNINRPNTKIYFDGCGQMHYAGNGIVSKIAKYLYQDATIFLPRKYDIIKDLLK